MMDIIVNLLGDVVDVAYIEEIAKAGKKVLGKQTNIVAQEQVRRAMESYKKESKENLEAEKNKSSKKKITVPSVKAKGTISKEIAKSEMKISPTQLDITNGIEIDRQRLREGIILSEILGPPVSRKRRNRMGRM